MPPPWENHMLFASIWPQNQPSNSTKWGVNFGAVSHSAMVIRLVSYGQIIQLTTGIQHFFYLIIICFLTQKKWNLRKLHVLQRNYFAVTSKYSWSLLCKFWKWFVLVQTVRKVLNLSPVKLHLILVVKEFILLLIAFKLLRINFQ